MSVLVMRCTSAEQHPDADRLKVYSFESGEKDLQVVANLTNVYEVGDHVAVAQVGSILPAFDNLEIKAAKIRGVESFGMALGKVEAEVGTELGDDYTPPE